MLSFILSLFMCIRTYPVVMLSFILSLFMCIRTYHVVIDRVGHYLCRRKLFLYKMWHSLWALFIFPFQISYLIKPFPLSGCQKRSHNNELGKHLFNLNVYYYSMSYHLNQHDLRLNEHIFILRSLFFGGRLCSILLLS